MAISRILLLLDSAHGNSSQNFRIWIHLFLDFIEVAHWLNPYFNTSDSNAISLSVQRTPSLISQFSGLFSSSYAVVIENEFTHFTHGFTKAHCIVYHKCRGRQAERRSVTATPYVVYHSGVKVILLCSAPIAIR